MKKLITIIMVMVTLLWVTDSFGQTDKGSVLFGGTTNLSALFATDKVKFEPKDGDSEEWDGPKTTAFNFSPRVGYFIFNNFAFGLMFNYDYLKEHQEKDEKYSNEYTNTWTTIAAGPFIQFYFGKGNIKPFVEASAGFGQIQYKYESPDSKSEDTDEKYNLFGWEVGAGVAFFVNEHIGILAGVGYGSDQMTHDGEHGKSTYTTSGIGVDFGIVVYL